MAIPPEDRPLDPEKLLRLASLVRAVLDEAKALDPDSTPSQELANLHTRITSEMREALPNALIEELQSIGLEDTFADGATGPEIRIAYSGLVGWLQGLFQGLSAAMQIQSLQQMGQLEESKRPEAEEEARGRYL